MGSLLAVEDALAAVLAHAAPLPAETVPLEDAGGRILAADVVSTVDLPPFPSSSMDGFAVRAADTPGTLRVAGTVAAGHPLPRAVAAGEAVDISTGGVVPEGADAVVPIERVTVRGDLVDVPHRVAVQDNVRLRGGDASAGGVVLTAGVRLTAARVSALAACGVAAAPVHRAPRVSIVVTGSELRAPGTALQPGQIYESNGIMLAAVLAQSGALVERIPVAEDSEEAIGQALRQALEADVVVTSGGVSVGPHDLVRRVEESLGVDEIFWGVAMRPGKPLAFGVHGSTLVFGLPGNPVSTLVGALLFVQPALRALQGDPHPQPPFRPGTLLREVTPRAERDDYVRARITWAEDGPVLEPISGQESHMIVRSTAADAIIHVPRGAEPLPPGSRVAYLAL